MYLGSGPLVCMGFVHAARCKEIPYAQCPFLEASVGFYPPKLAHVLWLQFSHSMETQNTVKYSLCIFEGTHVLV